jgi:hypothetical protein
MPSDPAERLNDHLDPSRIEAISRSDARHADCNPDRGDVRASLREPRARADSVDCSSSTLKGFIAAFEKRRDSGRHRSTADAQSSSKRWIDHRPSRFTGDRTQPGVAGRTQASERTSSSNAAPSGRAASMLRRTQRLSPGCSRRTAFGNSPWTCRTPARMCCWPRNSGTDPFGPNRNEFLLTLSERVVRRIR